MKLSELSSLPIWAAAISLLWGTKLNADTDLIGPFVPGSGNWTTVPHGNMEVGPETIPSSTKWTLDGNLLLLEANNASGMASTTAAAAAAGNLGADIIPGTFTGSGIALLNDSVISVTLSETIVLSAFVRRVNGSTSTGNVYLDLWDVNNDPEVKVSNVSSEWQFVYGLYTVPDGFRSVGARVVIDTNVSPLDEIYVDELAVTPLADFIPPQLSAVPEPLNASVFASLGLAGVGLARKLMTRRLR